METEIHDPKKRPIAQLSIEARLLYEHIKQAKIGDQISYVELTGIAGTDVRIGAKSALSTARKIAQRDDRMIFECVSGQGLVRLDDKQIVATGDTALRRMGRLCRRAIKKISCVDRWDDLSNEDRIRHNTRVSMFGAVERMSRPASIKKIEGKVGAKRADQLPVGRILEVFLAKGEPGNEDTNQHHD